MATLFLVRHGQASFLADDYDRLSPVGRMQAVALGKWLRVTGQRGGLIVCGGMRRHRDTAAECLDAWGDPGAAASLEADAAFDEFDHLDVLGALRDDLRRPGALAGFLAAQGDPRRAFHGLFTEAVARWTGGGHDADYRESWGAFRARCIGGMRRLIARAQPSQDAWVFTSGGPVAVVCQHALGLDDARALGLNAVILNTAVTRLLHDRRRLTLGGFNSVAHLDAVGDAALFTHR